MFTMLEHSYRHFIKPTPNYLRRTYIFNKYE